MKAIMPFYIMVFGLCLFMATGMSIVSCQLQATEARELEIQCVDVIQASASDSSVIEACKEEVEKRGDGWSLEVSDPINSPVSRSYRTMALNYRIQIPFFGISKDGTINSYIR